MAAPEFVGEHTLGRTAAEGESHLVAFKLPVSTRVVTYTSDEVASFCPVTGQPDFYVVEITLSGYRRGIESKSLKLFLQSFNDKEKSQFCEQFCETIALAVRDAVAEPGVPVVDFVSITVTLTQKARGGISIMATSILNEDPVHDFQLAQGQGKSTVLESVHQQIQQ